MFCVIITNVWRDIWNSYMAWGLPSFEYVRKSILTTSLRKARRGRDSTPSSLLIRYNTHTPWRTTSTIQTNWNHHHFFHLDTNRILDHVLAHSVDKIEVQVVIVELTWLLFLNILSFNFVRAPNKSLLGSQDSEKAMQITLLSF